MKGGIINMSNNKGNNTARRGGGGSINNVVLVGNLTKDPEIRETNGGSKTITATLAVGRKFATEDQSADFIQIVLWNQQAEFIGKYAQKGTKISVEGRIQTRNYENKAGDRVYVTEVVGESVEIMANGRNSQGNQGSQGNYQSGNQNTNQNGGNYNNQNTQGYDNGQGGGGFNDGNYEGPTLDISSDDLPF